MGRHEGWRPVPGWFRRVLHLVIYAEGRGGYLATQALSAAMSVDFPDASEVLAAWASGLELKQLAATLGISRHSSARRLKRLRGRMGEALSRLGIGHAWYHVVKARVEAMFPATLPVRRRQSPAR